MTVLADYTDDEQQLLRAAIESAAVAMQSHRWPCQSSRPAILARMFSSTVIGG